MATLVTSTGKAIIVQRMFGSTPTQQEPQFIGWGIGAGSTTVADTALFTEAAETRVSGTSTAITTTDTNDTHQCVGTMTSLTAQTITNAGIFDSITSGGLYVKGDFTGIPVNGGDQIQFTFTVQLL